ncbi:trypsin-like serine protease [Linderina pennispora]|uniref:Trypsin-like serine protease n=1 Tax=Linderina pennispora TaxID=61395 RepID=A0A1Y1WDZ6_9FUNG|nr:trypsin-like serine protease [Linderina pennispora]ORX71548.1 trypsin-like serine protease [Linderina pennispora]
MAISRTGSRLYKPAWHSAGKADIIQRRFASNHTLYNLSCSISQRLKAQPMKLAATIGITLAATALGPSESLAANVAPVNKYPFASIIKTVYSDGSLSKCGGTIISRNHVVTAAHCVVRTATGERAIPKNTYAGYGNNVYISQTLVPSCKVFVHPQYNSTGFEERYCRPGAPRSAARWSQRGRSPGVQRLPLPWHTLTVPSYPLKEAEVKIGSIDPCKTQVETWLHDTFENSNGPRICLEGALMPGNGSCSGDSGSPLLVFVDGVPHFAGVDSNGGNKQGSYSCGQADGFDFYTHVNYHLSFINEATGFKL